MITSEPNTYSQIHIQAVFAVKHRAALIQKSWKDELCKYITTILQKHGHKMLAINGVEDHMHIFFGFRPTQPLSDLMREIKASSSNWINNRGFLKQKFEWQRGYGAFSYGAEDVQTIVDYIINQEEHHGKQSFLEEYKGLLLEFEVQYDPAYIFHEAK